MVGPTRWFTKRFLLGFATPVKWWVYLCSPSSQFNNWCTLFECHLHCWFPCFFMDFSTFVNLLFPGPPLFVGVGWGTSRRLCVATFTPGFGRPDVLFTGFGRLLWGVSPPPVDSIKAPKTLGRPGSIYSGQLGELSAVSLREGNELSTFLGLADLFCSLGLFDCFRGFNEFLQLSRWAQWLWLFSPGGNLSLNIFSPFFPLDFSMAPGSRVDRSGIGEAGGAHGLRGLSGQTGEAVADHRAAGRARGAPIESERSIAGEALVERFGGNRCHCWEIFFSQGAQVLRKKEHPLKSREAADFSRCGRNCYHRCAPGKTSCGTPSLARRETQRNQPISSPIPMRQAHFHF